VSVTRPSLDAAAAAAQRSGVFVPRASAIAVALVATLAGGGSAAANWGTEGAAAGGHSGTATEMVITPLMELPNGCGEDWSTEGSID
jgi:hypothetical protein